MRGECPECGGSMGWVVDEMTGEEIYQCRHCGYCE